MQNIITREELKSHIENNDALILVDALKEEEFSKAHLPNAINIPVDQIEEQAPQLLKNKNSLIVTYCTNESCPAAKNAAEALRGLGYTNVREYSAGKEDWGSAGYPMEGTTCTGGICSTSAGGKGSDIPAV